MNWMDELRRLLRRASQAEPAPAQEPGDLTCREAAARVYEWLDGELDDEMQARVGEHLHTCAHCYPFLQFEEAFRKAVQRAGARPVETPPSLEGRVMGSLRDAGFGGGGGPVPEGDDREEDPPSRG